MQQDEIRRELSEVCDGRSMAHHQRLLNRTRRAVCSVQFDSSPLVIAGNSTAAVSSQHLRHILADTPDTRDILARMSRVSGDFPVQLATRLPDWSAGGLLPCIVRSTENDGPKRNISKLRDAWTVGYEGV